ncbi:PhzF family phenazine biosynthesis protein [Actinophytocola gossypii]|uniref:PhzF family phenazine biosynthesis protein n=1 Tax=Actinophytocola gossypii TaxID=2812003 RepID=A0ABT2JGE7_9PSEU|nr:PhzF family phenazine biosynthesis protein [Actinophytocola gossypii]MCT2586933.1 PhzF family phenazine biosynthesis protein [Actinophytocola gossypii]
MISYVIADVFADEALRGNPVAVFLDADDIPGERMQRIAREMNLSETTFVLRAERGGDARIRIFTPVTELPFAGHPTLGTAIVLGAGSGSDEMVLETGKGPVPVRFERGHGGVIREATMRQPIPTWEPYPHAEQLLAALGVGKSTTPVIAYRNGPRHVYVGMPDVDALSALRPDLGALGELEDIGANCFAGDGASWRLRMFAPAYGVAEDPATGSAAGPLALHLARCGLVPYGTRVEIGQGVEIGRASTMYARVVGSDSAVERIEVAGSAVVVARGEFLAAR